jgi:hypothetical protein
MVKTVIMKKTQIFTLLTIPVIFLLSYLVVNSVKSKIDDDAAIKKSEEKVRKRLMEIREAQKAFQSVNKYYTSNWDSLINFVETGLVFNVQKREIITTRPPDKSHLGDSVRIEYDTLGSDPVMAKVFPKSQYPTFNPKDLPLVPGLEGKKFAISSGKKKVGKAGINEVLVDVVEVVDPYPLDKTRSDKNDNARRKFLRFGSMEEISLSGNWEDK